MAPARRASSRQSTCAATTRSFRAAQIADCVRHGTALLPRPGRGRDRPPRHPGGRLGGRPAGPAPQRQGRPRSPSTWPLPVVAWTAAAEAEVLVGAPKARRRFMDRGVVGIHPAALELLGRYREALRQKRGLLLSATARASRSGTRCWPPRRRTSSPSATATSSSSRCSSRRSIEASGLPFPPIELRYRPSPANGLEGPGGDRRRPRPHRRPRAPAPDPPPRSPPRRARDPLGRATRSAASPPPASARPSP